MIDRADPVLAPSAYRESLLSRLGADDPALVQAATIGALRELLRADHSLLRVRPGPGEWSAVECIGHLVDSELMTSVRVRWILAEEQPELVGYDQELWASRFRHVEDDPGTLVALFEALRRSNLDLWARASGEDRARVGLHRERGPESYDLIFRLGAGHDRVHLAQARAALDATRASARSLA
jgi:hypothetical protein